MMKCKDCSNTLEYEFQGVCFDCYDRYRGFEDAEVIVTCRRCGGHGEPMTTDEKECLACEGTGVLYP